MINEPDIDKDNLKSLLEEKYGLKVSHLVFQPKGEVSWSYIVHCEDATKYFFKIHKTQGLSLSRLELLYNLHSESGIQNISYPLKTKAGELEIKVNGSQSVLFNYIDGKTSGEQDLSQKDLENLGELLGKIHHSKESIGEFTIKEEFKSPFKEGINKIYENINTLEDLNEVQQETRNIYLDYKAIFLNELNELENTAKDLTSQDIEFVNCHGEPSPDNIMISESGKIYLIDWDAPIFAPKEKDLMFFTDRLEPVMSGYGTISKDIQLNQDALKYYRHLWNTQEIEDWGTRIFFEEHTLNEQQYHLNQLNDFLNYSGLSEKHSN